LVFPKKNEILERAKRMEMVDIVGKGLPSLTPEDYELKESGSYERAKRDLMSPKSTAFMQQRKYLDEMAGEMGLVVHARKYVKNLERAEKRLEKLQRKKIIKVEPNGHSIMFLAHMLKPRTSFKMPKVKLPKMKPPKPKAEKKKQFGVFGPIAIPKTKKYEVIKPHGTLQVGRILNMPSNVYTWSLARRGIIRKTQPPKPKKKRQRLHTGRNGKTPRYLRKRINDGQKSFSFPDSIWKVRSPRRRKRR